MVVLKILKPLLDEVVDYKIPLDEILYKECEELDVSVNEAQELMENWCPKMSKIYSVSNALLLLNTLPLGEMLTRRITIGLQEQVFF